MRRRATFIFIALTVFAAPSPAQERFPVLRSPRAWTSLTIGLYRLPTIFDSESNSDWDFGNIVQFRATLERDFQRGAALGVAATYARAPLTYRGPDCASCDADVALWQALAVLRLGVGGRVGLSQIIEIGAGVTGFSNFQRRAGGRLAPATVVDPTVALGYGLAYSFSPTVQLALLQEVGLLVHHRGNRPAGDESNLPSTYATRIGLRFGLGG